MILASLCAVVYISYIRSLAQKWHTFLYTLISYALTSLNIDRFSNFFQSLDQINVNKSQQLKTVFNGDTAYVTQLKQQKSKRC